MVAVMTMVVRGASIAALVLLFSVVTSSEASAQFTLCNETPVRLYTAFGYHAGEWTSEGWWPIEPDGA